MLRSIFHNLFNSWTWYDQSLLFVGAFLVILGILIFVFRNGKWLGAKTEVGHIQSEVAQKGTSGDTASANLARWTLEQLTRERQMPRDFIEVYPQKVHLYLDSVSGPFLYFRFVIKSHALHVLDLHDSALSGFIEYKDHELSGEKKLEIPATPTTLKRESQATLVIKQFLQSETAAHIRKLHDDKDEGEAVFSFGKVSISAIAHRPDGTTESWILSLASVFKRRISDELIRS